MEPITANEIAIATGGKLVSGGPNARFNAISTDSRNLAPGALFVPLKGDNFDGHAYIAAAMRAGAGGALTSNWPDPAISEEDMTVVLDGVVIEVEDTLKGLADIARFLRLRYSIPVVGLTGSTGKTTTKDMLNSILCRRFNVVSTEKNFNNEIGVPLTLFRVGPDTEAIVVEMGMRGPGQIEELCRMAQPNIGIITNVGTAHYGLLGSVEAIANAKAELVESLPHNGVAVLNAENEPWARKIARMTKARVLTFGLDTGEVRSVNRKPDAEARYTFILVSPWGDIQVKLGQPGLFNITNALSAAAAAAALGCTLEEIKAGLEAFKPTEFRMEVIRNGNVTIINDVYNANPTSMIGAIRTLAEMEGIDNRIAVLGAMLELGDISKEQHRMIGNYAYKTGIDYVAVYHEEARGIKCGAVDAGMDKEHIRFFEDHESTANAIKDWIKPKTAILVKGSRGMKMEKITELIKNGE